MQTVILEEPGRFTLTETTPPGAPGQGEVLVRIDIGKRSPAVPVTPPYVRVRIRRFGGLSDYRTVNLGIPSESK